MARDTRMEEWIEEGCKAKAGSRCPYRTGGTTQARHAWLAGHIDKHGAQAWEVARE